MIRFANLSVQEKYFKWQFADHDEFYLPSWIKEEETVYDCDICGNNISYWVCVYSDETIFYRSYHEWYIVDNSETYVENIFNISEISRDNIDDNRSKENLKFVI